MTNHRFVLDSEGYVVDTSKSNFRALRVQYCDCAPCDTSENSLRESMLFSCLHDLVDKFLVNNNPVKHNPYGGAIVSR
jgi:hypothetical protein